MLQLLISQRPRFMALLFLAALFGSSSKFEVSGKADETGDRLIAIDVLLEPDSTMVEKAKAANARLRADYPQGYALDATHAPHITLVQRYIRANDLQNVALAVGKVLSEARPLEWQLDATGYEYGAVDGKAITLLMVHRSQELVRLQAAVVKAVEPFAAAGASSEAFVTDPDAPQINQQTIDWVARFVPNASGDNFKPHVTVGVASENFVKRLQTETFKLFTFKVDHVAIYQLGNFGTARKKLWTWNNTEQ